MPRKRNETSTSGAGRMHAELLLELERFVAAAQERNDSVQSSVKELVNIMKKHVQELEYVSRKSS